MRRFLAFVFLPLVASAAPTFHRDIAPILLAHCLQCHRPGGIAQMADFTTYEAARPWAKAIKAAVNSRQMPPWSADPNHSVKFRNDPRLTAADIATFTAWADAGAPPGPDSGTLNLPEVAAGWNGPGGRKPDLVISMAHDVQVPPTGDMPYVRLLVKLPLTEDKWIAASQARPGNATVVHHMAITEVEAPQGVPAGDVNSLETLFRSMGMPLNVLHPVSPSSSNPDLIDMLAIYTPGSTIEEYGDDSAKLLKGGANNFLNFNIHYSSHGSHAAADRSQVAFWFRDSPPKHQIYRVALAGETIIANGRQLSPDTPGIKAEGTRVVLPPIAPGDANYKLVAVTAFPQHVTIYQLQPHAHFRGREFTYQVIYPDGREQTLLTVPQYDFRWQLAYELETPAKLPAGSKLIVTGRYDNSAGNKSNPAPDQEVKFLDQNKSTDEMFSPFVQYSIDSEDPSTKTAPTPGLPLVEATGCLAVEQNNWVLATTSQTLQLIGLAPFNPSSHTGQLVSVKGLPIGDKRLNVTSLQTTAQACPK